MLGVNRSARPEDVGGKIRTGCVIVGDAAHAMLADGGRGWGSRIPRR